MSYILAPLLMFSVVYNAPAILLAKLLNIRLSKTVEKDGDKVDVFDIKNALIVSTGFWLFLILLTKVM